MRLVVAGDDHQPRGVLVEAVDDPRPLRLAAAEQLAERVDQRLAAVPGRRVDDQPGRLVDHREPVVDVDEPRRRRLTARVVRLRRRSPARSSAITTHPDGDRDVGEVERRPQRRVDEVGDGAVADPVGEVAERAAGEQPDPEPEPGPGGVEARTSRRSAPSATAVNAITSASSPSLNRPKAIPLLVTRVRSKPSARSVRSPGSIEPTIAAFSDLVEREHQRRDGEPSASQARRAGALTRGSGRRPARRRSRARGSR